MNIFEQATRIKARFTTNRGYLTVEQLWDLPLQSKDGFDLDNVAKEINGSLKEVTEESFVNVGTNPVKPKLEMLLDIVKHIIAVRLEEIAAAKAKAERLAEREKLIAALGDKQDEKLRTMSEKQLRTRISELGES